MLLGPRIVLQRYGTRVGARVWNEVKCLGHHSVQGFVVSGETTEDRTYRLAKQCDIYTQPEAEI